MGEASDNEQVWGTVYYLVEDPDGNQWRRPAYMELPEGWKALTQPGEPLPSKMWALRRKLDD